MMRDQSIHCSNLGREELIKNRLVQSLFGIHFIPVANFYRSLQLGKWSKNV